MPLYAIFRPTIRNPGHHGMMELMPSREQAARILNARIWDRQSATYYLTENPRQYKRPQRDFLGADTTASLAVWLRTVAQGPPRPTMSPDERWSISPTGTLQREPWNPHFTRPAYTVVREEPEPVIPARPVRVTLEPCRACFMIPTVTGRCNCS